MTYQVGDLVFFAGHESTVKEVSARDGRIGYRIENGTERVPMWVPAEILEAHQIPGRAPTQFSQQTPTVVMVDDFFHDPDEIREVALAQEYFTDPNFFKGLRSRERFLWPYLREEFSRLLGRPVTEWLGHGANGRFQQTAHNDPLVWHHDDQQYAAAVYLTPDAPLGSGTSFWRDRTYGCRHAPSDPKETLRLGSPEAVRAAESVLYDTYNFDHPDNWELVESVAGLYNRLVIWDAKLFHSASSYEGFATDSTSARLVQLFFFDAN